MISVPVVFLDRDGVINVKAPSHQYIIKWEDFIYLPKVYEAIAELNAADFKIFIVSNQRCVARKMATCQEIDALNRIMLNDLKSHGCSVDGVYYCPHDDADYCNCRKPKTGLMLQAEEYLNKCGFYVDKLHSWMVGDFISDIQAGIDYGINTVHVIENVCDTSERVITLNDNRKHLEAKSLIEAVSTIRNNMEEKS